MKQHVLVGYHFYAHYREPVMRALASSRQHCYTFVGSPTDPQSSIKTAELSDLRFEATQTLKAGRMLFPLGTLSRVISSNVSTVILLGNYQFLPYWLTAMAARLRRKRVLLWTHGWISTRRSPLELLRKSFYRLGNGLLLYGNRAKQIAMSRGWNGDDVYVVYNSLDYVAQRQAYESITSGELVETKKQLFRQPDLPVVLFSGRLTATKQLDLLLRAADRLASSNHRLNVLLIGEGPERSKLEALSQQIGPEVRFVGACYAERDLALYTKLSNVTVSPGPIGLTAMQSLAFGTPVISNDNFEVQMPEAEAIIPGITGDLFPDGDLDGLVGVMKAWTSSTTKSAKIGRNCNDHIRTHYTPEIQRQIIDAAVSGTPSSQVTTSDCQA